MLPMEFDQYPIVMYQLWNFWYVQIYFLQKIVPNAIISAIFASCWWLSSLLSQHVILDNKQAFLGK